MVWGTLSGPSCSLVAEPGFKPDLLSGNWSLPGLPEQLCSLPTSSQQVDAVTALASQGGALACSRSLGLSRYHQGLLAMGTPASSLGQMCGL